MEIVSKNPVNEPTQKTVDSYSNFDLSRGNAMTHRYGEYAPVEAIEVTPKDKIPYRLKSNLRSFAIDSPLMENVRLSKDYFFVPAEAILPLNWDKVYSNPLHGDDVDASLVGCTVKNFDQVTAAFFNTWREALTNFIATTIGGSDSDLAADCKVIASWFKLLLCAQMVYSNGSLVSEMGARLHKLVDVSRYETGEGITSFDRLFDYLMSHLSSQLKYFVYRQDDDSPERVCEIVPDSYTGSYPKCTLREFLEFARDDFGWSVLSRFTVNNDLFANYADLDGIVFRSIASKDTEGNSFNLNLARFWAYQLVCAHYFSNDKVDFVYDAELFRQNVYDCLLNLQNLSGITAPNAHFVLNGSSFRYDSLSAFNFTNVLSSLADAESEPDLSVFAFVSQYLRLLFGFNRSLRYVDYFTGSKVQPLAVGDVNVGVASNMVNVIDITRNIQKQKFLNAVNRFGRRISEYVKGLFGVSQAPDYHNPFFLSHTTDYIGNMEVENTGDSQFTEQRSVSTILRQNSERFEFEFNADRVGILLGVISYDIRRFYTEGVERVMTHTDRYDMFNPFMQFTGDQPVYQFERSLSKYVLPDIFAYQMRYAEYKQRVSVASGGFVEYLPGWLPLAEEGFYSEDMVHVSPSFIRSRPSEFDKYFNELSNYSLAGYFHFILVIENMADASRPMAFAPSIL